MYLPDDDGNWAVRRLTEAQLQAKGKRGLRGLRLALPGLTGRGDAAERKAIHDKRELCCVVS